MTTAELAALHGYDVRCWGWGAQAVHDDAEADCVRCGGPAPHHHHLEDGSVAHLCTPDAFRRHLATCPHRDRILAADRTSERPLPFG